MGEGERRRRDSEAQGSPKWDRSENVQKMVPYRSLFLLSFPSVHLALLGYWATGTE